MKASAIGLTMSILVAGAGAQCPNECAVRIPFVVHDNSGGDNAIEASISPDGLWVAFMTNSASGRSLRIAPYGSTASQLLFTFPSTGWNSLPTFTWRKDYNALYQATTELYFSSPGSTVTGADTADIRRSSLVGGVWSSGTGTTLLQSFPNPTMPGFQTPFVRQFRLKVVAVVNGRLQAFGDFVNIVPPNPPSPGPLVFQAYIDSTPANNGGFPYWWLTPFTEFHVHDFCFQATGGLLCSARLANGTFQFYRVDATFNTEVVRASPITRDYSRPWVAAWTSPGNDQGFVVNEVSSGFSQIIATNYMVTTPISGDALEPRGSANHVRFGGSVHIKHVNATSWRPVWIANGSGGAKGGGEVELADHANATTYIGSAWQPTNDEGGLGTGRRIAYTWDGKVWTVEMDREIQIGPRAVVGQPVYASMPVASNEQGLIFVSDSLVPGYCIPGFPNLCGAAKLNPATMQSVAAGVGIDAGFVWTIPNNPAFVGLDLFYQGVRFDASGVGDVTRVCRLRIY